MISGSSCYLPTVDVFHLFMMNLIIIFGPPAVGKMTVGQELEKLSGYPLFHNHMSIELVNRFFDFGTPSFDRLDEKIRFAVFNEVANSGLPGLIFTFVWALNDPRDKIYIENIIDVFDKKAEVYFIELIASQENRLERNNTENRLMHKPSKRNIKASEQSLLNFGRDYRMNSTYGEFEGYYHLRINTDSLEAVVAAERIFSFVQKKSE